MSTGHLGDAGLALACLENIPIVFFDVRTTTDLLQRLNRPNHVLPVGLL